MLACIAAIACGFKAHDNRLGRSVRVIVRVSHETVSVGLLNFYLMVAYKTMSSF
jgi:hypothetical protein